MYGEFFHTVWKKQKENVRHEHEQIYSVVAAA